MKFILITMLLFAFNSFAGEPMIDCYEAMNVTIEPQKGDASFPRLEFDSGFFTAQPDDSTRFTKGPRDFLIFQESRSENEFYIIKSDNGGFTYEHVQPFVGEKSCLPPKTKNNMDTMTFIDVGLPDYSPLVFCRKDKKGGRSFGICGDLGGGLDAKICSLHASGLDLNSEYSVQDLKPTPTQISKDTIKKKFSARAETMLNTALKKWKGDNRYRTINKNNAQQASLKFKNSIEKIRSQCQKYLKPESLESLSQITDDLGYESSAPRPPTINGTPAGS